MVQKAEELRNLSFLSCENGKAYRIQVIKHLLTRQMRLYRLQVLLSEDLCKFTVGYPAMITGVFGGEEYLIETL